ncbi:hypothetical protein E4T56_gene17607, partial [Termitomyces sp. T112]
RSCRQAQEQAPPEQAEGLKRQLRRRPSSHASPKIQSFVVFRLPNAWAGVALADKRAAPKLSTVGQSGHTSDSEQDLTADKGQKPPRKRIRGGVPVQAALALRRRTACDAQNRRANASLSSPEAAYSR